MENQIRLRKGHCYVAEDKTFGGRFVGIYMGREDGYPCMVCGKGGHAYGFNVYQGDAESPTKQEVEDYISSKGYETFFYGKEHMPEVIREVE